MTALSEVVTKYENFAFLSEYRWLTGVADLEVLVLDSNIGPLSCWDGSGGNYGILGAQSVNAGTSQAE